MPYIDTESENQNSGFNIFLVSTHSACPYKSCGLKWSQKSQTLGLHVHYLTFFFLLSKYYLQDQCAATNMEDFLSP